MAPRDPVDRACALHEEAMRLRDRGRPSEARRACVRALALFQKHEGRRHPDAANVLIELAAIEQALGSYADGLRAARRALSILAPLRGDVVFDQLRVQALLREGELLVAGGAYAPARAPHVRALAIAEKKLGDDDVAIALNGLAVVGKYTGRFAEAARLYRRALAITKRVHGPRSVAVAAIFHNLGGLEHARGSYAKAEPFARRSVAIRRAALGEHDPEVATDVAALAAILSARATPAKRREAESLYRGAILVFRRRLGVEHAEVGFNLAQLAALLHDLGRLGEAARHYARAARILERALGPRHPWLAEALTNFATLRGEQGRAKEAEPLYRRALAIYRATLGSAHPDARACEVARERARVIHLGRRRKAAKD